MAHSNPYLPQGTGQVGVTVPADPTAATTARRASTGPERRGAASRGRRHPDTIRALCAGDEEAARALDEAELPALAHGANQWGGDDNVMSSPTEEQGNSRIATLRRLKRDHPALAALVVAGELSANAAAIEADVVPPTVPSGTAAGSGAVPQHGEIGRGRGRDRGDMLPLSAPTQRGNSRAYRLGRRTRDRPDLAALVVAGGAAGYRRWYRQVPPQGPPDTEEQYGTEDTMLVEHLGVDGKALDRRCSTARTAQALAKNPAYLAPDAGPHTAAERASNGSNRTIRRGTRAEYLTARIARDRPDILEQMKAGAFRSVRQAAIAAGIVQPPTPLDQACPRAEPKGAQVLASRRGQARVRAGEPVPTRPGVSTFVESVGLSPGGGTRGRPRRRGCRRSPRAWRRGGTGRR